MTGGPGGDTYGIDPHVYHRRWVILGVMCLSLVLVVATVSSVNVAIPSIAAELRPTDTQLLWIVDAYAVVFAGLLLPAGNLGDRFGRKGALMVGLAVFALASVASALVDSPNALIATRAVMGVGAALIMPSTLSLLSNVFPAHERGRAIAIWAGFAGAGGAIGPVLGGLLVENYWFGSVFLVPAPIAVGALIAIATLAPTSRDSDPGRFDPVGTGLSVVGFVALLFGIIEGHELGWTAPVTLAAFVVAIVCLGGFVLYEQRCASPLLDMTYFGDRRFSTGAFGITFIFFAMFSLFFLLTQYLQYVKGYSPLQAGVRGLPFAFTMVIVSPRSPRIAARFGLRSTVTFGCLSLAVGLFLLSRSTEDTPYWLIAVALVTASLGPALSNPSLTGGILASVPLRKAGVGSAVNDVTREVGGAIGIAVLGTIVNAVYGDRLAPALVGLPDEVRELAGDSVAKADAVAAEIAAGVGGADGAATAEAIRTAARSAFVDATHTGFLVSAVLMVVVAVVMWSTLPRVVAGPDAHQHVGAH